MANGLKYVVGLAAVSLVWMVGCSAVGTDESLDADPVAAQSAFSTSAAGTGTGGRSSGVHLEFENLHVQDTSPGDPAGVSAGTVSVYSGGKVLNFGSNAPGDFLTVALPMPMGLPGTLVGLRLRTGTGDHAGIVQVSVATGPYNPPLMAFQNLGNPIDMYGTVRGGTQSVDLGSVPLQSQPVFLKFTVVGKNPASAAYYFGLDSLDENTAPP